MEGWPDDAQFTYVHSQINLYVHGHRGYCMEMKGMGGGGDCICTWPYLGGLLRKDDILVH